MNNIIVTNQKINKPGTIMSVDEFIEKASSDEGIGGGDDNLYIDVKDIGSELYEAIIEDSSNVVTFFTLDNNIPSFIESKVEKWNEKEKEEVKNKNATFDDTFSDIDINNNKLSGSIEENKIEELFKADSNDKEPEQIDEEHEAEIMLFGSSKGGTGKTFTCLISAYRYAKTHPGQRIAVSDFDIIDGQVGISIHKVSPTMYKFYKQWKIGNTDFRTMENFKVKSDNFPSNIDFYLAPRDLFINNNDFWNTIFVNLIKNYDVVFFDSGIDYMNYTPISTLYKIADKIILISTTSIKSVSSVSKQIRRLKGEMANNVFSKEDEIEKHMNLVITQAGKNDEMNATVFKTFSSKIDIVGIFGVLTSDIQKAEYYGQWNIFDDNSKFNQILDKIVK